MKISFNPDYIIDAPLWIQIHLATAIIAFALGTAMWLRPKGTKSHKRIGRVFVVFMLAAALSSIFIREINDGKFWFIHLFIIVTIIAAFELFYGIRSNNMKMHKRAVKGMFFGALLIPGILSFMPGRRLFMMFFGG